MIWNRLSKSNSDTITITNKLANNLEEYQGDIEYLEKELEIVKESVLIPYIDIRARENDLNDDLLEEVKIAFNEISNKEKTIKHVVQLMDFLLERYSKITEDYTEKAEKLACLEEDNLYLRDNVISNLTTKLDRAEKNIEEMERHLITAENEVRDVKLQQIAKPQENLVLKSMNALEQRVRRQSLLDSSTRINGLEEALQKYKSNIAILEKQLDSKTKKLEDLKKENESLRKDLDIAIENREVTENDMAELNKMKMSLEQEFGEAVENRETEINKLKKQLLSVQEEYDKVVKDNKELESKLSIFRSSKSSESPTRQPMKNGDRIDTQASNNDDDPSKRFDEHIQDAESGSDNDLSFDDIDPYYHRQNIMTVQSRGT
jgi:chromosome segregation ATPase